MVGRIERVQSPRTPAADEETLALWYELGRLYGESGGGGQRATKLGFAVVCVVGALVLLSAPVFGTAWAGPFAAVIPVAGEAAAPYGRSREAACGTRPRRATTSSGRARRVLRRPTHLAEERVRIPAGAGCHRGGPPLRGVIRLHP